MSELGAARKGKHRASAYRERVESEEKKNFLHPAPAAAQMAQAPSAAESSSDWLKLVNTMNTITPRIHNGIGRKRYLGKQKVSLRASRMMYMHSAQSVMQCVIESLRLPAPRSRAYPGPWIPSASCTLRQTATSPRTPAIRRGVMYIGPLDLLCA
jgi:hypothetical protein